MQILKFLLLFVSLFFCSFSQCQKITIDSIINIHDAKSIIEFLCADSLKGRWSVFPENKIAADYIKQQFDSAGLKPLTGFENFLFPFVIISGKNKKDTCYNVIAGIEGKSKLREAIIFSAHYDHIGTFSTNPFPEFKAWERRNKTDSIYNGANDDASGIAALILLARYFAAAANNERTIIFAAFSGEEAGLLGSAAFAGFIDPQSIKALINIEMIGRAANAKNPKPFVTGGNLSNLISILNKSLAANNFENYPPKYFIDDHFIDEGLFPRGDNFSFARFNFPSHSIMLSSAKDKYYHSVDDEPKNIEYAVMVRVIKAIAYASLQLIDGSATPVKIDR